MKKCKRLFQIWADVAKLERLEDVGGFDLGYVVEIGDSASDLNELEITAGGESEFLCGIFEDKASFLSTRAIPGGLIRA